MRDVFGCFVLLLFLLVSNLSPACAEIKVGTDRSIQDLQIDEYQWQRLGKQFQTIRISAKSVQYALDLKGTVWRLRPNGWVRLPGKFRQLMITSSSKPAALSDDGTVHLYNGMWWQPITDGIRFIGGSEGSDLLLMDKLGKLQLWEKGQLAALAAPKWEGDQIQDLALSADGTAYLLTLAGALYQADKSGWRQLRDGLVGLQILPKLGAIVSTRKGEIISLSNDEPSGITLNLPDLAGPLKTLYLDERGNVVFVNTKNYGYRSAPQSNEIAETTTEQEKGDEEQEKVAIDTAIQTRAKDYKFKRIRNIQVTDLGIGRNGSVFIVTPSQVVARWNSGKRKFQALSGQFSQVSVAPDGLPWALNSIGEIFNHTGQNWKRVSDQRATDISVSSKGDVFILGSDQFIYRLDWKKDRFQLYAKEKAHRIAAISADDVWIISSDKRVFHCQQGRCLAAGLANTEELAVGPDGTVLAINAQESLMRWREKEEKWTREAQLGGVVAVGPSGFPWASDQNGNLFATDFFDRDDAADEEPLIPGLTSGGGSKNPSTITFTKRLRFREIPLPNDYPSGSMQHFNTGADGTVFFFNYYDGLIYVYDEGRRRFVEYTKLNVPTLRAMARDIQGRFWYVQMTGEIYKEVRPGSRKFSFHQKLNMQSPVAPSLSLTFSSDGKAYIVDEAGRLFDYDPAKRRLTPILTNLLFEMAFAAPNGSIWLTRATTGQLVQYDGKELKNVPARGGAVYPEAVAVSPGGTVYMIDAETLFKYNTANDSFDRVATSFVPRSLTVDSENKPWVREDIASDNLHRAQ
ncbi:MAG: hypothetical protein JJ879_09815 [Sneathiella sp.]|nr:hypothetical protein [Sneathiella sp.]